MYDEPVAVPIIDLLDSNMMSQYISAAREQYNQAVQDQKEFAKEFGELYGPNANINKEFYDITRGAVNKGLDYLYQNGIDPLRSAEGRAYIAKIIRERPYAEIANLKAQNESMKTYQRYRAEAMRNGTYDPEFEKFVLGGKTLESWDPSTDGMWTREAPSKYSSLKDWTSNLFDNMELEYDPELTKQAGGLYQVYSKSPKKMQQILDANIKDMTKSDLGRYYLNMYGGDIDALKADIINRNREYTQVDRRADQVKVHLNDQRFQANEAAKQRAFQHSENELNRNNQRYIAEVRGANKNGSSKNGGADGGYSYSYTKKVKNAETAAGLRDRSGKLNSNLDPAKVQSMTEQQLKDLIRLRQGALSKSVKGPVTATTVISHLSRTGDDPAVFGTRHGLTGVPGSKSKKINYTVDGSTTLYSAQDIYNSMSGRRVAWKGKITNIVDKNGRIIKLGGGGKFEILNNVKNRSRIEDFIGDPKYSVVMRPTTNGETVSVVGRDGKLHTYDAVDIYIVNGKGTGKGSGKGSGYKCLNRTPIRSYVPVSGTDLSVDELGISADYFIAKKNGYKTTNTTVENPSDFDY